MTGIFKTIKQFRKRMMSFLTYSMDTGKSLPPNAMFSVYMGLRSMTKSFNTREFTTQISCSLNYLENNRIAKRNLFQKNLEDVFMQNSEAIRIVTNASKKTSVDAPILNVPDDHRWVILSMVQAEISESSGTQGGYFLADLGLPRICKSYCFTLANELSQGTLQRLRIILVQEELLSRIAKSEIDVTLENPDCVRSKTIMKMAELYKTGNLDPIHSQIGKLEICIPRYTSESTQESSSPILK